jgi:hypothetical protein
MRAYSKAVSQGHYYTCYALQTCQPHQSLPQQAFVDDAAVLAMDSGPAIA